MGRNYLRSTADIEEDIEKEQELENNPIKKNATKYANQKQILTGNDLIKKFHAKFQLKHDETMQKLSYTTDLKEHETTDYLRGRLNILHELMSDCKSIINNGTLAEQYIVNEENKKNEKQS